MSQEFPAKLIPIRDAAIESAWTGTPLPDNFPLIQEWIENDGWEALLAAWINEQMVLDLKYVDSYFSDDELLAQEYIDTDEIITDKIRVEYAREILARECDGDYINAPSVHCYFQKACINSS